MSLIFFLNVCKYKKEFKNYEKYTKKKTKNLKKIYLFTINLYFGWVK